MSEPINWTTIALIAAIALIAVFAIVKGRGLKVKGGGLGVEVDPSKQPPPPPPDLEVGTVKSGAGKAVVREELGGRVKVEGVDGRKGAEVVRTGGGGAPKA